MVRRAWRQVLMRYRILGPFDVIDRGVHVAIPAAKQRCVLAILLLHAGSTISGRRLVEELWGEHPPVSARKVIQTYVSKLRQVLPRGVLLTQATGYTLRVHPDDLDAAHFERLVAEADVAPPREEADILRRALGLWRGRALEDFADEPFAQGEIVRLEGLRRTVLERRIELDLADARHSVVVGELSALVRENPWDERLRGHLMLALYRSGRQTEALDVYRDGRRILVEQLGVEPTPQLRGLEQAILRQEPALDLPEPAAQPGSERRRAPYAQALDAKPYAADQRRAETQRRWTLPAATSFVGRGEELGMVRALLLQSRVRLLTLTGPAGTGKTRLALEAASALEADYPDGAAVVDLTMVRDHELVASVACSALRLRPGDGHDAAADLARFLSAREQLLVLDNFEHVLLAADLVAYLLTQASGLTVLATSRSPLGVRAERVLTVSPLPVPSKDLPADLVAGFDAVALFTDRARAVAPGFSPSGPTTSTIGQLCARLDGLPLAIELAAARADLLSPRAMLSGLGRRLDLLTSDSVARPERHRSLRTAIEWSYELLDDDQKEIFCDLSAFAGGFTVGTAVSVVASGQGRVLDAVRSLRNASLLRSEGAAGDEPRFGMLQTVREYGRERLDLSGGSIRVRTAHALAYLRLAREAEHELRGPDQLRWLGLLEAELPNIREALQWAANGGDLDTGLSTAAYLWRFWQARGRTGEARTHLEGLLSLPAGSPLARADAHLSVARCAFHQEDLRGVEEHLAVSVPIHHEHRDAYAAGFGLMILGTATGRRGDFDRGGALLRQALDVARQGKNAWLEACCLGYLGMVFSAAGRYTQARRSLEDGLRSGREIGDSRMVSWFLVALGRTAVAAGDPMRARRRFTEALAWERRLADAWGEARALQGLADVAIHDQDHDGAVDLLFQSVTAARRAHSPQAMAGALRLLAKVAQSSARPRLAAELLGAASVASPGTRAFWAIDAEGLGVAESLTVRAAIGDDAFDEQWARGRALTSEEAVDAARHELAAVAVHDDVQ